MEILAIRVDADAIAGATPVVNNMEVETTPNPIPTAPLTYPTAKPIKNMKGKASSKKIQEKFTFST
jgi:hypothetical protein